MQKNNGYQLRGTDKGLWFVTFFTYLPMPPVWMTPDAFRQETDFSEVGVPEEIAGEALWERRLMVEKVAKMMDDWMMGWLDYFMIGWLLVDDRWSWIIWQESYASSPFSMFEREFRKPSRMIIDCGPTAALSEETFDETDPTVCPWQLKAPQTFLPPTKRAAKITLVEFVSQVEVEVEGGMKSSIHQPKRSGPWLSSKRFFIRPVTPHLLTVSETSRWNRQQRPLWCGGLASGGDVCIVVEVCFGNPKRWM